MELLKEIELLEFLKPYSDKKIRFGTIIKKDGEFFIVLNYFYSAGSRKNILEFWNFEKGTIIEKYNVNNIGHSELPLEIYGNIDISTIETFLQIKFDILELNTKIIGNLKIFTKENGLELKILNKPLYTYSRSEFKELYNNLIEL